MKKNFGGGGGPPAANRSSSQFDEEISGFDFDVNMAGVVAADDEFNQDEVG